MAVRNFNHLNAELNPMYHFLALLGAHPILHVSGVRVNLRRKLGTMGNIRLNHCLIYSEL